MRPSSNYTLPLLLMCSVFLGGLSSLYFGASILVLKPVGDIFLRLIFSAMVPLIFFSISSAIARMESAQQLGRTVGYMTLIFLFTGTVASFFGLTFAQFFRPETGTTSALPERLHANTPMNLSDQLVNAFTVSDFSQLLSHQHILALIVFSVFVGLATASLKDKVAAFKGLLESGEQVFLQVFNFIMKGAPIGFFAYFAVMVHEIGPHFMQSYAQLSILYYACSLFYFIVAYSAYAFLAGGVSGLRLFWRFVWLPAVTAIATCSSAASIPANLVATKRMGVSHDICDTVIPLGSMIHKDGSVIGGVFKIAFLFGLFHMDFSGFSVLATAFGISLLVGTVMGAIPSGGMLGELLILSVYGFPPSVLIAVAAISIIIDPIATLLNVTGNTVSAMMIDRCVKK